MQQQGRTKKIILEGNLGGAIKGTTTTTVFSWQGTRVHHLSELFGTCFVLFFPSISLVLFFLLPPFSLSYRFSLLSRFDTWRGVVLGPHSYLGTHERQDMGQFLS